MTWKVRKLKSEKNPEFEIQYCIDENFLNNDDLTFIINNKHNLKCCFSDILNLDRSEFNNAKTIEDIDKCLLPVIDKYLSYWKNKEEFLTKIL